MKLDEEKRNGRFAQRALRDFSAAMFDLLAQGPFEKLSVNAVCTAAGYPRSTFYNYFEDLYDLMDWCWQRMGDEADLAQSLSSGEPQDTVALFAQLWGHMDARRPQIAALLAHNRAEGAMLASLRRFMRATITDMFLNCGGTAHYELPAALMAEHYANVVEMLLEKGFLATEPMGLDEALRCLDFLIGTLERERDAR